MKAKGRKEMARKLSLYPFNNSSRIIGTVYAPQPPYPPLLRGIKGDFSFLPKEKFGLKSQIR